MRLAVVVFFAWLAFELFVAGVVGEAVAQFDASVWTPIATALGSV
jgi:hypothetical protein